MSRDAYAAARRDVLDLCQSDLLPQDFIQSLGGFLMRAVPADTWLMDAVDPATFISVCGCWSDPPGPCGLSAEAFAKVAREEFLYPGVNSFVGLAASAQPAAALSLASVDKDGPRSVRLAHYRQAGISDELRVAFVSEGACWGVATWCRRGGKPFSSHEVHFMASVSARVGAALRRSVWRKVPVKIPTFPPAIVVLDRHDEIAEMSAGAHVWLDELKVYGSARERSLPLLMSVVAQQARESSAKPLPGGDFRRVKTATCGWVSLRGASLSGAHDSVRRVAVIVKPASRHEIADFFLTSHRISSRERQIAILLTQGYAPEEISRRARLSLYTVRDHVKRVFEKCEVHSRVELMAKLFVHSQPGSTPERAEA